jgi:hypothetical protein
MTFLVRECYGSPKISIKFVKIRQNSLKFTPEECYDKVLNEEFYFAKWRMSSLGYFCWKQNNKHTPLFVVIVGNMWPITRWVGNLRLVETHPTTAINQWPTIGWARNPRPHIVTRPIATQNPWPLVVDPLFVCPPTTHPKFELGNMNMNSYKLTCSLPSCYCNLGLHSHIKNLKLKTWALKTLDTSITLNRKFEHVKYLNIVTPTH